MYKKKIDILMATYNGGRFIENQLLSLQQQTYKNWNLLIHDDGSTDDTIDIIERYEKIDPRIRLIRDGVTGLGAGNNFLSLLAHVTSRYAIFCDQDDIWLENKVDELVGAAEQRDLDLNVKPAIIYSDGYPFSSSTGNISFENIAKDHASHLKDFLFFNGGYQGCSIIFNKPMIDFLKEYKGYVYLHDDIISLVAHSLGDVYFLPKKLMLYRQHVAAVTGEKDFKRNLSTYIKSPVRYLISTRHYKEKESFYENYNSVLDDEAKEKFKGYFDFCNEKNKIKQLILILKYDFTLAGSKIKLMAKTFLRNTFDS